MKPLADTTARPLHEHLARHAQETPNSPAIGTPQRGWMSTALLASNIESFARQLRAFGLREGDPVAVVLPNGPEMALAFLGVTAAAVCAPLNPALTRSELEFYLDDLDARAVIVLDGADHEVIAAAVERNISVLSFALSEQLHDAAQITLAGNVATSESSTKFDESVALVLHTSGTTARPKIVPLSHANLAASSRNIATHVQLTNADRCGNIMPLFHIHGLMAGLAAPLSAGGSVLCTTGYSAPHVLGWFESERVTWTTAVPTLLQSLAEQARAHPEQLPSKPLRFLRSSSASLPPLVMHDLEQRFNAPVVEAYGMTEAAHQMCCNPLPPGERRAGSVGVAAGPEVAIMANDGTLTLPGVIGEVVIRGKNVTTGYATTDAQINERAFTNGWFRTGDQGTIDDAGYLTLTGRLKEIINRGGEKIAPREIDEVLLDHPAVRQALCFAVPDSRLGEQIAAIVVAHTDATIRERELREFASLRLAPFKVPRRIVIADSIPTGATGKLQRIGLAQRLGLDELDATTAQQPHTAPTNPVEQLVHSWWAEILGIKHEISIFDHFLDLGGDSLLAAKLLGMASTELGITIHMLDFFDAPTIAAQSALIEHDLNV